MIARPPEKKFSSKRPPSSFFVKVANDNRPPKRNFLGWLFLITGILVFLAAAFWIYEKVTSYYNGATSWWTDEQALNKNTSPQKTKLQDI